MRYTKIQFRRLENKLYYKNIKNILFAKSNYGFIEKYDMIKVQ